MLSLFCELMSMANIGTPSIHYEMLTEEFAI
jgi:hypothetical protein